MRDDLDPTATYRSGGRWACEMYVKRGHPEYPWKFEQPGCSSQQRFLQKRRAPVLEYSTTVTHQARFLACRGAPSGKMQVNRHSGTLSVGGHVRIFNAAPRYPHATAGGKARVSRGGQIVPYRRHEELYRSPTVRRREAAHLSQRTHGWVFESWTAIDHASTVFRAPFDSRTALNCAKVPIDTPQVVQTARANG